MFKYIFSILAALSMSLNLSVFAEKPEIQEWLDMIDKNPDDSQTLKKLASSYLNEEDYEKSLFYAKKLVEVGEKTGDRDFSVLYGMISIAHAASMTGDNETAFQAFENARTIAEMSDNHDALTSVHNGLGMYYLNTVNDPYSSISHFYDALEQVKITGNEIYHSRILANLSSAYLLREDPAGLKYCLEAYERAAENGDRVSKEFATINLADFYLMTDSLDKALPYINEVNAFPDLSPTQMLEVGIVNALYNFKTGKKDYAIDLLTSTLQKYMPEGFKPSVTYVYLNLGQLLNEAGRYSEAIKVFSDGLSFSLENGVSLYKERLMKGLSESYRNVGDYVSALDYASKYSHYNDSVYKIDKERAIEDARVRHNIALHEAKIAWQDKELEKQKTKFYVLILVLVIVLVAVGAGWYIFKKKKRLYNAIVSQNREFLSREKYLLAKIQRLKVQSSPESQQQDQNGENDASDHLMAKFIALMTDEKLFKDPTLTVAAVAEKLGTNRTYLSRTINEGTGKTFSQVVNGYRIKEAIALISDSALDMPLKQVCTEAGFSSLSTFYSLFQNFTGLTPARYRAQIKNL